MRVLAVPLVALALAAAACAGDAPRADPPSAAPSRVGAWRTEVWHDLAVEVPADWDWGSGAADVGLAEPTVCGGPGPDSQRSYVGRPVLTSDVCLAADQLETPRASYVWLGAPLAAGSEELGEGWVRETVEVHGTTLTVASDDPGLRQQVLRSAREQDGCGTTEHDPAAPGSLCVYGPAGDDVTPALLYATTVTPSQAKVLARAVAAAPVADRDCDATPEYVVVTVSSGDRYVIEPACDVVTAPDGRTVALTDATRPVWARDGVALVLRSEIGMLG